MLHEEHKKKFQNLFETTEDEVMRIIKNANRNIEEIKKNVSTHIKTEVENLTIRTQKNFKIILYVFLLNLVVLIVLLIKAFS